MIKGSIQEEDITPINAYTLSIGALKYMKWILTDINREIDNNTILVGDMLIIIKEGKRDKLGMWG